MWLKIPTPNLCIYWFFILPPPRSFLTEQLSQDVAEMLLVVQKEVDDDGTWLKADDTRKWWNWTFSLFFSLNVSNGREKEKHWSAEKLYGEQRCSLSSTRREVWENDLVLPRMKEPFIWSHTGCACGRHYYSRASHVTLLFSLLSGTTISHFISIYALHCWSRSKICVSFVTTMHRNGTLEFKYVWFIAF